MKKTIILMSVMLVALLFIGIGCNNRHNVITPTPTPRINPSPTIAPVHTPGFSPETSPLVPNNGQNGMNGTNGMIEGFREGEMLLEHEWPSHVATAIRNEYPNATVKNVSYATHPTLNRHMYLVTLEGVEGVNMVYVDAQGTLTHYDNNGLGQNGQNTSPIP